MTSIIVLLYTSTLIEGMVGMHTYYYLFVFYLAQSRNQIKARACHIRLTLIRHLFHLNRSEDGLVKLSKFLQTLNMYHIRINEEVSANDTIFYGLSTQSVS